MFFKYKNIGSTKFKTSGIKNILNMRIKSHTYLFKIIKISFFEICFMYKILVSHFPKIYLYSIVCKN